MEDSTDIKEFVSQYLAVDMRDEYWEYQMLKRLLEIHEGAANDPIMRKAERYLERLFDSFDKRKYVNRWQRRIRDLILGE